MLVSKIIIREKNKTFFTDLKYFLKRLFHRSRYDFSLSSDLNLNVGKEKKYIQTISSKFLKKKSLILATASGLFHLKYGKLYNILNNNVFYGLGKYKKKFFVACAGSKNSQGCIVSFNYLSGEIKNIKIEFKIRNQYLHDLKIHKNNLYVVNSSVRVGMLDEILKFEIKENSLKLKEKIKPEIDYPFLHLNSLFFKKNSILLCYHNMTQRTKIPSQVCEFKNNWQFLKILKTENLSSAHDSFFLNDKLHVLDSDNGIFYMGRNKINFKGKFIKGIFYDKKNFYIGLNPILSRHKRSTASSQLGIIERRGGKRKTVSLTNIGIINSITILE